MSVKNSQRVEVNTEGLPIAWEILKRGKNTLTINGVDASFSLSESHIETILKKHQSKGIMIPIDANHTSLEMANTLGVEESDLNHIDPTRSGRITLGFAHLSCRDQNVWVSDVSWNELGKKLIHGKQYKYFSPVLKGLNHPENLRVSSVALTNEPRLDQLPALAASELENFPVFAGAEIEIESETNPSTQQQKESKMDELKKMLAQIFKIDPAMLDTEEGIANLKGQIESLTQKKEEADALEMACKKELKMSDVTPETLAGRVAVLSEAAQTVKKLQQQVDTLEMAERTRQMDALITQGKSEGKITEATEPHLRKMDVVALSELLASAPVVVQTQRMNIQSQSADSISLSEEDRKVCRSLGITEEQFLNEKKGK